MVAAADDRDRVAAALAFLARVGLLEVDRRRPRLPDPQPPERPGRAGDDLRSLDLPHQLEDELAAVQVARGVEADRPAARVLLERHVVLHQDLGRCGRCEQETRSYDGEDDSHHGRSLNE